MVVLYGEAKALQCFSDDNPETLSVPVAVHLLTSLLRK